jgi:hypothetical protein
VIQLRNTFDEIFKNYLNLLRFKNAINDNNYLSFDKSKIEEYLIICETLFAKENDPITRDLNKLINTIKQALNYSRLIN